jgi:thioredoxin-related protein
MVMVFAFSSAALAVPAGEVKWLSLSDGMAKAKAEKKAMIVDFFFSKDCPRCAKLEQNIYTNPKIAAKINSDFVPVFIDLTKPLSKEEEDLGNRFDYKKDCLMLFLDYDMNILKDPSGKKMCFVDHVEADVFNGYLDMIKAQIKK